MITAVIPARGGSKGLPGKNLRRLNGATLLARCVKTCRDAVGDVLVTTECPEIADEAFRAGARVHNRPTELATDEASTWDVIRDATASTNAGVILLAQCTAPLLTVRDILKTLVRLHDCDIAVACHERHEFLLTEDGRPINWGGQFVRRQDFGRQYAISGSVWAFRRDYLLTRGEYDGNIGVVLSEHPTRIDIDTAEDLRLAERVLRPEPEAWCAMTD